MLGAIRTFAASFAFSTKVRKNSSKESNDKSEEFSYSSVDNFHFLGRKSDKSERDES